MADLNWCTFCDNAINNSDSLYCSEKCLREDARNHHPLNGYDFAEFKDFPRPSTLTTSTSTSTAKSNMSKSSTQTSSIMLPLNQIYTTTTVSSQYNLLSNSTV